MALITIDPRVSIDANSTTFAVNGVAGVAVSAGNACTIDSVTGLVRPANNTDVFVGFVLKAAAIGKPVTLFRMAKVVNYSTAMTPSGRLYMAGAGNEGKLSDVPIVATDPAVALAVNAEDIIVVA